MEADLDLPEAQLEALEEIMERGEVLSVFPSQWTETLEMLAENGVSTREDLEKLVFVNTQEDNQTGLLEEVILVTAIWENLQEYVDTNEDDRISEDEWMAVEGKDIPVPTTPEVFKNLFKQTSDAGMKAILQDFFMASVSIGAEETAAAELQEGEFFEVEEADFEESEVGSDVKGMVPPSPGSMP